MAQGESPRSPLASTSVLYPGRCLAVELANPEPTGSSQQGTPRGLRTTTELFRPSASILPTSQWLSLPFDTPEGAWRLSSPGSRVRDPPPRLRAPLPSPLPPSQPGKRGEGFAWFVSYEHTSVLRVQAAESLQQHRRRPRRRYLSAQRRNAGTHGPSRARVPASKCEAAWGPLALGPFFNEALVPKNQLAILKTSKNMSWPRLASEAERPSGLSGVAR